MVEATGFEPTTLWSRTIRATNCATPQYAFIIYLIYFSVNQKLRQRKIKLTCHAVYIIMGKNFYGEKNEQGG